MNGALYKFTLLKVAKTGTLKIQKIVTLSFVSKARKLLRLLDSKASTILLKNGQQILIVKLLSFLELK